MRSRFGFVRTALLLFLLWLLLSGKFEVFYVALGLLFSLVIAWHENRHTQAPAFAPPLLRYLWYLPWLLGRVILANLHVAWLILNPALPLKPKFFRHQTRLQDESAVVLLGNSVTLTPGTITVEVSPRELLVHALDGVSAEDLTSGKLEQRIGRVFERRAIQ